MLKDILLFATADWAEQYWTNKQRMADEFARRGHRVLYIESFGLRSPGANKKDFKRLFRRLITGLRFPKEVKKNIWVLSPLVIPYWKNKTITKINYFLITKQIQFFSFLKKFQMDCIWTYHPFILPIIKKLSPKKNYYHVVDNITAVPNVDAELYQKTEKAFLKKVNAIFVTSHPLKTHYDAITEKNIPVYYSPNVVDVVHFSSAREHQAFPKELQIIPSPRLLYYGVLSDFKLDVPLLIDMVEKKPDWQFIFIGEEREGQSSLDMQKLKHCKNTHFLGYRPYSILPNYLSAIDVGILPLQENSYTRFMFPMKFFEFLAAGVPVVSTPIDALQPYHDYCGLANTADDFIKNIERCLQNKKAILSVDDMQRDFSWDARMKQVCEVIE